ncbi:TonB-dependent receptor [candidate division KSB1 bacterium]|nr:TonB-dependent receptor [candidate division KSB1 bacterium]
MHSFRKRHALPLIIFTWTLISITPHLHARKAPSKSNIKGYVRDARSGEALPYANITLKGTHIGTASNLDGYFVLVNIPVQVCSLQVNYIGYIGRMIEVQPIHRDEPLVISMKPTVIEVEGITVTAQAEMLDANPTEVSKITFSPRQLSTLPSTGEADIFRTIQLLPGISGVSDGSSGLYVRGGTPDQNLVLFDGMTIYHVDHFFGFFSAFNADAIKDIQLYKGGFPAEYGGRISSVVNLTGKTGHQSRTQFSYGINLLSARGIFELPLSNWGTFLIAGRRSYTDFIRSPLYDSIYGLMTGEENGGAVGGPVRGGGGPMRGNQMQTEFKPSFYFYDLNSKLTLRPSSKDILTFSFYNGRDDLDKSQDMSDMDLRFPDSGASASLETTDFTRWGNLGFSGKWSRHLSDRLHADLLAAHSNYFSDYDRKAEFSGITPVHNDSMANRRNFDNASKENNEVWDTTYKIDFDWQASSSHRFDVGYQLSNFKNEFSSFRNDSILIFSRNSEALLNAAYAQDKWTIKSAELTLGLRGSHYDRTNKLYYEPRASLVIPVFKNVNLKGAWGQYYQFVNQFSNEDVTQGARDFWLLADEDFDPGFAEHRILGINYEDKNYVFSVEAYQKKLENMIEFSRRAVAAGVPPGQRQFMPVDNFFIGTGDAKGVEFLLQKKRGALTGWLGYTLGRIGHNFPAISNGITFPANHDRRHEVNLVAKYQIGVWSLAATWVFASGSPYTAPESQYYIPLLDGSSQSYIHVSDKNANRLPDYHRLDISGSRKWESDHWETEIGVSIFNLYNHSNIWYRDYNLDTVPLTITDVTMLGFTPTVYIQMNLK